MMPTLSSLVLAVADCQDEPADAAILREASSRLYSLAEELAEARDEIARLRGGEA